MRTERSQQIARAVKGLKNPRPSGALYVVGVPIGHPDDLTRRALGLLREVEIIASEDPLATRSLLAHHGIGVKAELTSYGPANLKEKIAVLLHRIMQGDRVAIVSDCGSPVIADPGCLLVKSAHSHGIPVQSVPGPSAITAAVAVSGFSGDAFAFVGLLPSSRPRLKQSLIRMVGHMNTVVAFCPPDSLTMVLEVIGRVAPRRTIALACDLTHSTEILLRGTARQVHIQLRRMPLPLTVTLMIAGRKTRGTAGKKGGFA